MRKLKTQLADGNTYILSTLTLKEQLVARQLQDLATNDKERFEELSKKSDEGSITDEEMKEFFELQDKQMDGMLEIIQLSLAKNHKEFIINENNTKKDIIEKIKELIDLRDLRRFATFAMLGTIPNEDEEETIVKETIDLTVE